MWEHACDLIIRLLGSWIRLKGQHIQKMPVTKGARGLCQQCNIALGGNLLQWFEESLNIETLGDNSTPNPITSNAQTSMAKNIESPNIEEPLKI